MSVILGVKNEYPVILGTIQAIAEELSNFGWSHEFIVVDNGSTDYTADVLEDKFRRWTRHEYLKVIRYPDAPANVTVRNIGARVARGRYLVLADGHISIQHGTIDGMLRLLASKNDDGIVHAPANIWGDTNDIKCYGYRLRARKRLVQHLLGEPETADDKEVDPIGTLKFKFWGDHPVGRPKEIEPDRAHWRVPMAKHSLLAVPRAQYIDFGGYHEGFRCYGGGEPYLDFLWWIYGSSVYVYADGLHGHGFGAIPRVVEGTCCGCGKPKCRKQMWCVKEHRFKGCGEKGHFLRYSRGYGWKNDWFQANFIRAAYLIGGYRWLSYVYRRYYVERQRSGVARYVNDIVKMRAEILRECADERHAIESRQKIAFDDLISNPPWDWA